MLYQRRKRRIFQNNNALLTFIVLTMASLSLSKVEMGDLKLNSDKSQGKELISGDFSDRVIILDGVS